MDSLKPVYVCFRLADTISEYMQRVRIARNNPCRFEKVSSESLADPDIANGSGQTVPLLDERGFADQQGVIF